MNDQVKSAIIYLQAMGHVAEAKAVEALASPAPAKPVYLFRQYGGAQWFETSRHGYDRLQDVGAFEVRELFTSTAPVQITDAQIDDALGELHKVACRVNADQFGLPLHPGAPVEQLRAIIRALLNRTAG